MIIKYTKLNKGVVKKCSLDKKYILTKKYSILNKSDKTTFFLKAQFTVETALVFPIVLFTVLSSIYLTFYIHDSVLIKAMTYKSAIESVFSNKQMESTLSENVKTISLYLADNLKSDFEENDNELSVSGKVHIPVTTFGVIKNNDIISERGWVKHKIDIEKMFILKSALDKLDEKSR